jgi:hypothetical protein
MSTLALIHQSTASTARKENTLNICDVEAFSRQQLISAVDRFKADTQRVEETDGRHSGGQRAGGRGELTVGTNMYLLGTFV